MVYRDPESGKFVSGDGGAEYRDYEFQHVHSHYDVQAEDLPGAFPIQESDITTVGLDDVLHRDERADLVAVQIHSLQASASGTASAENALKAGWELTLGAGDEMTLIEDRQLDNNTGRQGVINKSLWQSDSPDVLYFSEVHAEGSFSDSATGVGGGADAPVITDRTHFPTEYGSCPTLDERDEITESISFNDVGGATIDDTNITLEVSYTLVFRVYDRD